MQTAEPGVYAIGDVVPPLACPPGIERRHRRSRTHCRDKNVRPINLRLVPNCTYCDPENCLSWPDGSKSTRDGLQSKVGKFPFPHPVKHDPREEEAL